MLFVVQSEAGAGPPPLPPLQKPMPKRLARGRALAAWSKAAPQSAPVQQQQLQTGSRVKRKRTDDPENVSKPKWHGFDLIDVHAVS